MQAMTPPGQGHGHAMRCNVGLEQLQGPGNAYGNLPYERDLYIRLLDDYHLCSVRR